MVVNDNMVPMVLNPREIIPTFLNLGSWSPGQGFISNRKRDRENERDPHNLEGKQIANPQGKDFFTLKFDELFLKSQNYVITEFIKDKVFCEI